MIVSPFHATAWSILPLVDHLFLENVIDFLIRGARQELIIQHFILLVSRLDQNGGAVHKN